MKTKRKERDMSESKLKGYGEDVFSEEAIRAFLPKGVAAKLLATMRDGKPLTRPSRTRWRPA